MLQPSFTGRRPYGALAAVGLFFLLAAPAPAGTIGPADRDRGLHGPPRYVLLLHAYPRLSPPVVRLDEAFRDTLETESPFPVYFYTEYLDLTLFDGDVPQSELQTLLRRKYGSHDIDLIVAAGSRALRVALQNRTDLFSGAPVVFLGVDRSSVTDLRLSLDVTGTWLRQNWAETLELARRLQPGIRHAIVVSGSAPSDLAWQAAARHQLATIPGGVEISYITGASVQQITARVAALPDDTVVLMGAFVRDATGQTFNTRDAIARVARASSVPVYVLQDHAVGAGAVGGDVVDYEAHGRTGARLALRVLSGERPDPTDAGTTRTIVDWREIRRWDLDERRLPPGADLLFREPSLWERHRGLIIGAAALLLLQSALIATLLVHRVQRRRVRHALAERLRFETLLSDLSAMFAAGPVTEVDQQIGTGLRRIVEDLGADRATVGTALHLLGHRSRDAFLDAGGRDAAPRGDPGRGRALDRIPGPARPGRGAQAARGPPARGDGGPGVPDTARHAVHHRGASRRGRRGHRHARGGHAPRGAALAR